MKGSARGSENPFFKVRILPAVEERLLRGKTGYLLMDKYWDLDFDKMIKVMEMVDKREVEMRDLDGVVWAFQEELGWVRWKVRGSDEGDRVNEEEEGARRKIGAFKVFGNDSSPAVDQGARSMGHAYAQAPLQDLDAISLLDSLRHVSTLVGAQRIKDLDCSYQREHPTRHLLPRDPTSEPPLTFPEPSNSPR